MSRYIQIPNRINQIKSKARLNMIYCYALIRSQIKDNTYTAAYPEKQLAAQLGVDERTIGNYIRFFKEQSDLFKSVTKKQGEAEYKYNVY